MILLIITSDHLFYIPIILPTQTFLSFLVFWVSLTIYLSNKISPKKEKSFLDSSAQPSSPLVSSGSGHDCHEPVHHALGHVGDDCQPFGHLFMISLVMVCDERWQGYQALDVDYLGASRPECRRTQSISVPHNPSVDKLAQPAILHGWYTASSPCIGVASQAASVWGVHLATIWSSRAVGLLWGINSSVQAQQLQGEQ